VAGNAEAAAARFGIPKWTINASEVIEDPEIDAVIICSPTDKHAEHIVKAAKHKKHIFCEKPIDLTLDVVNHAIKAVRACI
jgi:myo-inositol 2-dehydrogenase/D-chiro-inositol 1-dehydrogenase